VLHIERRGRGPRLALVHGFTQSGAAWGPVGEALSGTHEVLALDAPGHGRSAAVEADLPGGAEMMADAVLSEGGPASWLGYSMGGRFALHVALQRPEAVDRLVLVSATAGIDDEAERSARRESDRKLADRVEAEGLEPFVRWWLTQPMFAGLAKDGLAKDGLAKDGLAGDGQTTDRPTIDAAQLEGRLGGTAAGLASSLRLAGTGTQEPLWDQLGRIEVPVLVVAGAEDHKFLARAERLRQGIGANATLEIVAGAGHACHLEQPDRFLKMLTTWLA
jgi:2-succinyl-6-hydroxy-2,4-cyclohexadiene-1-carboxylate synthase